MPTCQLCENDFPNTKVIDGKRRYLNKRSFCLDCSPFGITNRKSLGRMRAERRGRKPCLGCGEDKKLEDYYSPTFTYCIPCESARKHQATLALKRAAVDYKGGQCVVCGYDKCLSGLAFHHRDPATKETTIGGLRGLLTEAIKAELDKCELVCQNCHAETHCTKLGDDENQLIPSSCDCGIVLAGIAQ